jgi:hypothetical protein
LPSQPFGCSRLSSPAFALSTAAHSGDDDDGFSWSRRTTLVAEQRRGSARHRGCLSAAASGRLAAGMERNGQWANFNTTHCPLNKRGR